MIKGGILMKKNSHFLAAGSLTVMGAGFLATIPFQHEVAGAFIHGGFEAGLVGGLADWFAVTALFRHPMGLPIPHTALLPKKREQLTNGIVHMVENEWLTKESIQSKLNQVQMSDYYIPMLEKNITNPSFQNGLTKVLHEGIESINIEWLASLIESKGKKIAKDIDSKKVISYLVDSCMANKYDEKIFDYVLYQIEDWARKDSSRDVLGRFALNALDNIQDGFFQMAIKSFANFLTEDKVGNIIQGAILKGLPNLHNTGNENRKLFLKQIRLGIEKLKDNDEIITNIDDWKNNLIDSWNASSFITEMLEQGKSSIIQFIHEDNFADKYMSPLLTKMVVKLKSNKETLSNIDSWINKQIVQIIESNHSKIGGLVRENLSKLDDDTLVEMVESNVGKDLQWIRVNGAICGFIIGLALEGLKLLF